MVFSGCQEEILDFRMTIVEWRSPALFGSSPSSPGRTGRVIGGVTWVFGLASYFTCAGAGFWI
jgi:hypothetical protein